jgi:hypothetical protein
MPSLKPSYPIYMPSKGRADECLTADLLVREQVPFHIVVEPQERELYAAKYGEDRLYVLPFRDRGLPCTRQWIREHSIANGDKRHWQLDDNMREVYRWYRGKRIRCDSGMALSITEKFIDRYTNVAIGGLNYSMFGITPNSNSKGEIGIMPPFRLNCHVYSCMLMLNEVSNNWRGRYNEDVDMNLQVLTDGWCTIQMQLFLIGKTATMVMKGGNTDELYGGDGRTYMARALERQWPGVVKTIRRYGRSQHTIDWKKFDNKLIRRTDIDFENLDPVDEHGLIITQVSPAIRSPLLQSYMDEQNRTEKPTLVHYPPSHFVDDFLNRYATIYPINTNFAMNIINQILKHRQASKQSPMPLPQYMVELENRWYESIEKGEPDYTVYDDDYAFTEMWVCWAIYSRGYLRTLLKPSVWPIVQDVKTIVDLGCGIGYTTAGFKQLFPSSEVTGTNLEGTKQYDFCVSMGETYDFKVASDIKKLGHVDLVFASEYFEHIINPIFHLEEILTTISPEFLYVANSFNTHSVGHFHNYLVGGTWVSESKLSMIFNKTLQSYGYSRLEINAWNNKPALWAKNKDAQ